MVRGEAGFGRRQPDSKGKQREAELQRKAAQLEQLARERMAGQMKASRDSERADKEQREAKLQPDSRDYTKPVGIDRRPNLDTGEDATDLEAEELVASSRKKVGVESVRARMSPPTERELGRTPARGLDVASRDLGKKQKDEIYEDARTRMVVEQRQRKEAADMVETMRQRVEQHRQGEAKMEKSDIREYEVNNDLAQTIERIRAAQEKRRRAREAHSDAALMPRMERTMHRQPPEVIELPADDDDAEERTRGKKYARDFETPEEKEEAG